MARNSENEPTHPPKTNESTTADFTTLPSYIGHQWEHHPNWLGKNQHLFQVTKRLKPGPRAGKLHLPEGVPAYGQPRSLFPTGPRCPVSNPKGSHLVMKKTTRKTCALGGFEVLRPWTFQEILVVRSQTYEFNGIIMPFLDGKLQPRCRSTRLRNALLGWSLFQACELGHPTTAVAKKNSFSMRAKGAKSFSSPAQKKNTHTRSKIRLVAGVEKNLQICSVQTYIINGHERWCICLCGNDHHEEKLANGHMAPLCGTSGSHSAAGIVSVSSIQWLGDLANEFAMVSSI